MLLWIDGTTGYGIVFGGSSESHINTSAPKAFAEAGTEPTPLAMDRSIIAIIGT